MKLIGKALAAVLVLMTGSAFADEQAGVSAIVEEATRASQAAVSPTRSVIEVKAAGDSLQDQLERAKVAPHKGYKWAVEKDLRDTIKGDDPMKLINAAEKRIKPDGLWVPGPTASEALDLSKKMYDDDRIKVAELGANVLGIYQVGARAIKISYDAMSIATDVGFALAAAVMFHELGHALDETMHEDHAHSHDPKDMDRVIREETKAFALQQRYMRSIYRDEREAGEIFATTLMRLEAEQRNQPHPQRLKAIAFLRNSNELFNAVDGLGKPDEEKIGKIVKRLYKSDGSPAITSA